MTNQRIPSPFSGPQKTRSTGDRRRTTCKICRFAIMAIESTQESRNA